MFEMFEMFECDSCGHEVTGCGKKELLDEGWKWHAVKGGRYLVVCGECEHEYAKRRALKAGA